MPTTSRPRPATAPGRRRRQAAIALVVAVIVMVAGAPLAWEWLRTTSALTAGYSRALPGRESRLTNAVMTVYETARAIAFYRETAARLLAGRTRDRERLATLMAWTHDNVRPQYAAPARVISDNFYDIVRRGFGYCDQSAHVFLTLAHYSGYEGRMLFLRRADGVSPHSVAEVRVGERWIVVDPWQAGSRMAGPVGQPPGRHRSG